MDVIGHADIASDHPVICAHPRALENPVHRLVCQNSFTLMRANSQENNLRAVAEFIDRMASWMLALRQFHDRIPYTFSLEGNAQRATA